MYQNNNSLNNSNQPNVTSRNNWQSGSITVQSQRVLRSNIVGEEVLGIDPQEEHVQYIEVPVVEEVIRHVPKKEYVAIEKRVPKYEYEWTERIVEVPQIHVVEKTVEVPQIQEVICNVPVRQIVEIPKEVIRRVPKTEVKIVEREVEVPGEIVEVPKPYLIENKIVIPKYTNKNVPTVVAQRLVPVLSESETEYVDVDLKEYNPYLVPVDVYVPRPVSRELIAESRTEEHRVVDVPIGQFNALLRQLNVHCTENDIQELLVKDPRTGAVPAMPLTAGAMIISPTTSELIDENYQEGFHHYSYGAPTATIPVPPTDSSQPPIMEQSRYDTQNGNMQQRKQNPTSYGGTFSTSYNPISYNTTGSNMQEQTTILGGGYSAGGNYQISSTGSANYNVNSSVRGEPTMPTYISTSSQPREYSSNIAAPIVEAQV